MKLICVSVDDYLVLRSGYRIYGRERTASMCLLTFLSMVGALHSNSLVAGLADSAVSGPYIVRADVGSDFRSISNQPLALRIKRSTGVLNSPSALAAMVITFCVFVHRLNSGPPDHTGKPLPGMQFQPRSGRHATQAPQPDLLWVGGQRKVQTQ